MRRFWWVVGLAASCLPVPSWAQQAPATAAPATSSGPAPRATSSAALASAPSGFEEEKTPHRFRRSTRQIGSALAVGFGTHGLGSKERHDLALASVRFGRMLGHRADLDPLRHGHFELLTELWGGVQTHGRRRSLIGLTPLLRYNLAAGGRWVPFVDAGVGVASTSIAGRDLSNGFQFNLQGGVGAHYFLREALALTLQYRWFHLSNAGLSRPNSGLNSRVILAGLTRFY